MLSCFLRRFLKLWVGKRRQRRLSRIAGPDLFAVRTILTAANRSNGFIRIGKPEPAVSRVLSRAIIHLGQLSPAASSNLPGSPLGTGGARGPGKAAPLFGLAPGGVYRAADCYQPRGALLPHLFTLTDRRPAVYFLWHFPWARAPQALPGALSEGARTFLCPEWEQRLPGRLRRFRTGDFKVPGRAWGCSGTKSYLGAAKQPRRSRTLVQRVALLARSPVLRPRQPPLSGRRRQLGQQQSTNPACLLPDTPPLRQSR